MSKALGRTQTVWAIRQTRTSDRVCESYVWLGALDYRQRRASPASLSARALGQQALSAPRSPAWPQALRLSAVRPDATPAQRDSGRPNPDQRRGIASGSLASYI